VYQFFRQLQTRYPATPLLLLSPLAEGADRLVARVALDCGVDLVVPLPLPRALYEQDFGGSESDLPLVPPPETVSSAADRDPSKSMVEFEALLGQAKAVFTLPLLGDQEEAEVGRAGEARDQQYAAAGAYIVRQCQILLALWDGVPSPKVGGTAQIVQFRLEGVPDNDVSRASLLDPPAVGPVYQIITPRLSNRLPAGEPLSICRRYPRGHHNDAEAEAASDRVYTRMNTFNRDACRLAARLTDARQASKDALLGDEAETLPWTVRTALECYAIADALALHFQRATIWTLRGLFVLAGVAAFLFAIFSDVNEDEPSWLAGYVFVLGLAFAWYVWARRRDYQNKYQDYRALAEGLRVQVFWQLAGIPDAAADHYLRKQTSELDWIRSAMRVWTIAPAAQELSAGSGKASRDRQYLALILRRWVDDQYAFFARAAYRDQVHRERLERLAKGCFVFGIGLAGTLTLNLLAWPEILLARYFNDVATNARGWLLIAMALPLLVAGLFEGYAQTRGLAVQAKQYQRMCGLFAVARERLTALLEDDDHEQARTLLLELGKEALAENGDWVLLHRERPMEVPA
jgi:hypothetical protein